MLFSLHIVVCERLSVPEIFDQIAQNTPVLEFGSRTSPPPHKINLSLWVQIWPIQEHPPPRNWNSNFFLWVQIWPIPEHPPPQIETLTFPPEFKSDLFQNTPPPYEHGFSWSMWRLTAVSPKDTI